MVERPGHDSELRLPKRRLRVVLFIGGIIAALGCLEVYFRVFRPEVSPYYQPSVGRYLVDPAIGYRMKPHYAWRYQGPEFNILVKTNSRGFRDREYAAAKPPGGFRILVLGDSFVEAVQVELERTFHKRLEDFLNRERKSGGPVFEVPAMGVGGWSTSVEFLALQRYGLAMRPDVVILMAFLSNDVFETCGDFVARGDVPGERNIRHPFYVMKGENLDLVWARTARLSGRDPGPFWRYPHRRSYAYYALLTGMKGFRWGRRILSLFHPAALEADEEKPLPVYREPSRRDDAFIGKDLFSGPDGMCWQAEVKLMAAMQAETGRRGARFLAALLPSREQATFARIKEYLEGANLEIPPAVDLDAPERQVADRLFREGVPSVLLGPRMRPLHERPEKQYFVFDSHLTEAGHRAVMQILYEELESRGWLPAGP